MNPSFTAFAGELLLIKQAKELGNFSYEVSPKTAEAEEPLTTPEPASAAPVQEEEKPFRSEFPVRAKSRLKSALRFGIGGGLGAITANLMAEKLLPKILPKGALSAAAQRNIGYGISGLGAIGSLALWDAFRQAEKAEEDALQRDRQRV